MKSKVDQCALQHEAQANGATKSELAVLLQEEFTLMCGKSGQQQQEYEVRQYMFSIGSQSSAGHFTVAVREQRDGAYHQGDKWLYLDSAFPAVTLSLEQLMYAHATEVYAVLMVAKVQPPDDTRPLLKAARYFVDTLEALL